MHVWELRYNRAAPTIVATVDSGGGKSGRIGRAESLTRAGAAAVQTMSL